MGYFFLAGNVCFIFHVTVVLVTDFTVRKILLHIVAHSAELGLYNFIYIQFYISILRVQSCMLLNSHILTVVNVADCLKR